MHVYVCVCVCVCVCACVRVHARMHACMGKKILLTFQCFFNTNIVLNFKTVYCMVIHFDNLQLVWSIIVQSQ